MTETLRAYTGPYAGNLYQVVCQETGAVVRNATALEAKLWQELEALKGPPKGALDPEQVKALALLQLIPLTAGLPPEGVPVVGFHPDWIDEDFNEKGFRECFRHGDGTQWISALWWDEQDTYYSDARGAPTHWCHYPPAPKLELLKVTP